MWWFISVLFLFNFMVSFAKKGEYSVVVLQKMGSSEIIVNSLIEAKIGANFTLICKIVDTATQKYLNAHVVWSKRRKKLKVLTSRMQTHIPNLLNFIQVNLKDQGAYVCKSTKYKQFKAVELIVKLEISPDIAKIEDSDLTYPIKRGKRDYDSDEMIISIDENNRDQNYNYVYNQDDLDLNFKDSNNHHDNISNNKTSTYLPIAMVCILLGVVVFFVIIYKLRKICFTMLTDNTSNTTNNTRQNNRRRSSTRHRPRTNNVTNHEENVPASRSRRLCLHRSCVLYRVNNPDTGCLFDPFDTHAPNSNRDLHSPLTAIIHNTEVLPTNNQNVDLPPSYDVSTATSTRNSTHSLHGGRILNSNNDSCDLPPSYEDVLNNIVDSTPLNRDNGRDYSA